jgi:hypothetical protein
MLGYTLVMVGRKNLERFYYTTSSAKEKMYQLIKKYGLEIEKSYNDYECYTYICHDGTEFHINIC